MKSKQILAGVILSAVVFSVGVFPKLREKTVNLNIDGFKSSIKTDAKDVKGLIKDLDYIPQGSFVSKSFSDKIKNNDNLEIKTLKKINLVYGGKSQNVKTLSKTLKDFLKEQGIKLDKNTVTALNQDDLLFNNKSVVVDVYETKVQKMTEKIAYKTYEEEDYSMLKDDKKILQDGKDGKKEATYEVRTKNGKIVSKKLLDENVIAEALDKVVLVGMSDGANYYQNDGVNNAQNYQNGNYSASNYNSNNYNGVNYVANNYKPAGKSFTMQATAYTGGGITASGRAAQYGVVAVDPSVIPLGTKLYIEGYGTAIAGDTGSAVKGNIVDLYLDNYNDAINFGRRDVNVTILP